MSQASPVLRRVILTGSIAAVTATGAWYGAGLKTQREHNQEFVTAREATPTERIAQLETARMGLLRQKAALERKIEKLEARGIGKKEVEKT